MAEEGFGWKHQQSWFQEVEKHDAEFVEKGEHNPSLCRAAATYARPLCG